MSLLKTFIVGMVCDSSRVSLTTRRGMKHRAAKKVRHSYDSVIDPNPSYRLSMQSIMTPTKRGISFPQEIGRLQQVIRITSDALCDMLELFK